MERRYLCPWPCTVWLEVAPDCHPSLWLEHFPKRRRSLKAKVLVRCYFWISYWQQPDSGEAPNLTVRGRPAIAVGSRRRQASPSSWLRTRIPPEVACPFWWWIEGDRQHMGRQTPRPGMWCHLTVSSCSWHFHFPPSPRSSLTVCIFFSLHSSNAEWQNTHTSSTTHFIGYILVKLHSGFFTSRAMKGALRF